MSKQSLSMFVVSCALLFPVASEAQHRIVSPSAGLSLVQLKGSGVLAGYYAALEMGRDRLKLSVELHATPGKSTSGDRYMQAFSYLAGQPPVEVPVHAKLGYAALVFCGRYYFVQEYEAPGNGFFIDAGLAARKFLYELSPASYDHQSYYISPEELSENTGAQPERSYGVTLGIGCQHNFENNVSVSGRLALDTDISGRKDSRPYALLLSAGIRYNFTRKI